MWKLVLSKPRYIIKEYYGPHRSEMILIKNWIRSEKRSDYIDGLESDHLVHQINYMDQNSLENTMRLDL